MAKKISKVVLALVLSVGLIFGTAGVVQGGYDAGCEYVTFMPLSEDPEPVECD